VKNDLLHEIQWRKLLLKRLSSVQAVLKRDTAAEKKRNIEAKQLAAGYQDFDEAHEAFGWGDITLTQLDDIKAIFDNKDSSPAADALNRLSQMIGSVQGEITMLINDPDYRDAIISERETE